MTIVKSGKFSTFPRLLFILIFIGGIIIGRPGLFQDGNNFVPTFGTPCAGRGVSDAASINAGAPGRVFGLFYGLNKSGAVDAAFLPNGEQAEARAASLLVGVLENVMKRVWKNT